MSFKHTAFTVGGREKSIEALRWYTLTPASLRQAVLTEAQHHMNVIETDLLERIWRSDDKDFPSVEVIIVDQACWESLHWVFVQI